MTDRANMVSVCMITYNHEKYIAEAIEGVIIQQTNFNYELVIGEDFSTDNTRKICLKYRNLYPDVIRLIPAERNKGMTENFFDTLKACSGKYIALCEGDDYWIDPYKLQKQADFLEANRKYSMVHTNGYRLIRNKLKPWKEWPATEGDIRDAFIYGTIARTCSVMFRKKLLTEYLDKYDSYFGNKFFVIGDWPLFAFLSTKGKIGYFSDRMAVYRFNPESVSSPKDERSFLAYSASILDIRRFLRDVLFKGELDQIYSETNLKKEMQYQLLKYAFNIWNFKKAKEYSSDKSLLHPKARKLAEFTKNPILFYIGCFFRKFKHILSVVCI